MATNIIRPSFFLGWEGTPGNAGDAGVDGKPGLTGTPGIDATIDDTLIPLSIPGPRGPAGLNGAAGSTGRKGPSGPPGIDAITDDTLIPISIPGRTGRTGTAGTDGATWRSGSGAPSNGLGNDGDFYFRTDTDDIYEKSSGTYSNIATIKGDTGPTGNDGAQGPAGQGKMGPPGLDAMMDDTLIPLTVPGKRGATGATGSTGTPGANGSNGRSIIGPPGLDATEADSIIPITIPGRRGAAGAAGAAGSNGTNGTNGSGKANGFRLTLVSGQPAYRPIRSQTPTSTDTTAETCTFSGGNQWATGSIVTPVSTGGGLTAGTTYYVHVVSSTVISFHTTVAGAIAGTSPVNLTGNITQALSFSGVAGSTLYFTPFRGNDIAVYNGSSWDTLSSAEVSIALGTLTATLPYDVFAYSSSGTLTLELVAWSSGTARATALVYQNGVYCKTGTLTKRYVGTIYTDTTTTTVMDMGGIISQAGGKAFVWNYDNRLLFPLRVSDGTSTWSFSNSSAFRSANGVSNNKVQLITGAAEDMFIAKAQLIFSVSGNGDPGTGIGLDSTTVNSAQIHGSGALSGLNSWTQATYEDYLDAGFHFIQWLEWADMAGTVFGTGTSQRQSGFIASVLC